MASPFASLVSTRRWSSLRWRERGEPDWEAWRAYLAQREHPRGLDETADRDGRHPLLWAVPGDVDRRALEVLVSRAHATLAAKRLKQGGPEAILPWECRPSADVVLQALAWAHWLPDGARWTDGPAWRGLLDRLLTLIGEGATAPVEDDIWLEQMLKGELPWTLACLFPELAECRGLEAGGRAALAKGLEDHLDGQGLPNSRHWRRLRPLLACWTRCLMLGREVEKRPWDAARHEQYQLHVREVIRLCRPDGTQVLCDDPAAQAAPGLLPAALEHARDADAGRLARAVLSGRGIGKDALDMPASANESEWAQGAVLWGRWSLAAPRLVVAFSEATVRAELLCGRDVLWSGEVTSSTSRDGAALAGVGDWEQVCWVSDDDADYLELERALEGGLRLQRQLLLCHEDQLLLLADALVGESPAQLAHEVRLPLPHGTELASQSETTEGALAVGQRQYRLLPLALQEWRRSEGHGRLELVDRALVLAGRGPGPGLFVPLVVDLRAARADWPLTWRTLTVAEQRAHVSPGIATGFRLQLGRKNWLVYRSLGPVANRTVLGHNLVSEFLFARFLADGTVEPLVEIEGPVKEETSTGEPAA